MTNEEYLRSCPTSELARYITACGYCVYLIDGCQRGEGCVEGHKLWLAREHDGKRTNKEALLARWSVISTAELARELYHLIGNESLAACDPCPANSHCYRDNDMSLTCEETIAEWLEAEAE